MAETASLCSEPGLEGPEDSLHLAYAIEELFLATIQQAEEDNQKDLPVCMSEDFEASAERIRAWFQDRIDRAMEIINGPHPIETIVRLQIIATGFYLKAYVSSRDFEGDVIVQYMIIPFNALDLDAGMVF